MEKEYSCEDCNKAFGTSGSLSMHRKAKHGIKEKSTGMSLQTKKKIKTWSIVIAILVVLIGLPAYFISNQKVLPPTDMQGHIEENPPSHVMQTPMKLVVHKHMLEHSDGDGPPGVIINYNCAKYECEDGLIEKLEFWAEQYPSYVYVAPFPKMDAKIALTRLGRIQVLDTYDEAAIKTFIERR